jgi:hypothetical protein
MTLSNFFIATFSPVFTLVALQTIPYPPLPLQIERRTTCDPSSSEEHTLTYWLLKIVVLWNIKAALEDVD